LCSETERSFVLTNASGASSKPPIIFPSAHCFLEGGLVVMEQVQILLWMESVYCLIHDGIRYIWLLSDILIFLKKQKYLSCS
jgi:hypothetical protein